MLRLLSIGFIAFVFGVGALIEGGIGPGVLCIVFGVAVGGYPGWVHARGMRSSWVRFFHVPASELQRSSVADDPVLGPKFRSQAILAMFAAVWPFVAGSAMVLGAVSYAIVTGPDVAAAAVVLILFVGTLAGLCALIPIMLALKIVQGARMLMRGQLSGAGAIKLPNWIGNCFAVIIGYSVTSKAVEEPGSVHSWIFVAAVAAALLIGLVVNYSLNRFVRRVRAAEFLQEGTHAEPTTEYPAQSEYNNGGR